MLNNAAFFRNKTFAACNKEIESLQFYINDTAQIGGLFIYINDLSASAIAWLRDNGFTVTVVTIKDDYPYEPDAKHGTRFKIEW